MRRVLGDHGEVYKGQGEGIIKSKKERTAMLTDGIERQEGHDGIVEGESDASEELGSFVVIWYALLLGQSIIVANGLKNAGNFRLDRTESQHRGFRLREKNKKIDRKSGTRVLMGCCDDGLEGRTATPSG